MRSTSPESRAAAPRSGVLALVLACWLSAPALGLAEEAPAPTCGTDPFEAGVAAFDAGELALGAACFREALAQLGNPAVRYNIAACLDAMGELPEARNQLMLYLRDSAPDLVSADRRELVEARIAALDERVAVLEVLVEGDEAELAVDGTSVEGGAATRIAWAVAPGEHEVEASRAEARPLSLRVLCGAGERCEVIVGLEAPPGAAEDAPPPAVADAAGEVVDHGAAPLEAPRDPPRAEGTAEDRADEAPTVAVRRRRRPPLSTAWFGATTGLAAALAVAGSVTGGLVYVRGDELVDSGGACETGDRRACGEARATAEQGEALGRATTGLFITAGIAAAAALVLAVFTDWVGERGRGALGATVQLPVPSGGTGLAVSAAVEF